MENSSQPKATGSRLANPSGHTLNREVEYAMEDPTLPSTDRLERKHEPYSGEAGNEYSVLDQAIRDLESKKAIVHPPIPPEYILVTVDWLRQAVSDYGKAQTAISHFTSSGCMLITFLIALVATDFKDAYGLSAETWGALFFGVLFCCSVWFVLGLYYVFYTRKQSSFDSLIERITGNHADSEKPR